MAPDRRGECSAGYGGRRSLRPSPADWRFMAGGTVLGRTAECAGRGTDTTPIQTTTLGDSDGDGRTERRVNMAGGQPVSERRRLAVEEPLESGSGARGASRCGRRGTTRTGGGFLISDGIVASGRTCPIAPCPRAGEGNVVDVVGAWVSVGLRAADAARVASSSCGVWGRRRSLGSVVFKRAPTLSRGRRTSCVAP